MRARAALSVLALGASAACSSSAGDLPPFGEAVVFVDTDLPAPALASRLRVDLYDESGRWFESRDIGRSDPRDWPASFSVFSDDETRDRRVMVRLRAYPEGSVRDYLGERFEGTTPFREPAAARDLAELCANAPELPLGGRVTLREGPAPLTEHLVGPTCTTPARGGNVAARFVAATAGTYRFAVASESPFVSYTTLSLRARCDDPTSQIACRSAVLSPSASRTAGHFPRFDATLEPGTYFVVTSGNQAEWPADVTLEVMPVDGALPAPPPADVAPEAPSTPRLRRRTGDASIDPTPAFEPVPTATVDRLLLLRLVPGRRDRVYAVLRGDCAGKMARLGADPSSPDLDTATTCVDRARPSAPLAEEAPIASLPPASEQGSFAAGQPCEPGSSTSDRVCVPGGAFLMGSRLQFPEVSTVRRATPERIAALSRFWIDRHEVTVARLRAAVARGFVATSPSIVANDVSHGDPETDSSARVCSWSLAPGTREDHALTCVTWRLARAFCLAEGGDLPTEAQWEYAATTAGRPFKTIYPWGNDAPTCDRAVLERTTPVCERPDGTSPDAGPAPVTELDGQDGRPGDVTPLGIANMAGTVAEWTRDSAHPYGSGCWLDMPITDPICDERDPPFRIAKGGSWQSGGIQGFVRIFMPAGLGGLDPNRLEPPPADLGFRCVYGVAR